jgi:two-component system, NarL family, sensor kinase
MNLTAFIVISIVSMLLMSLIVVLFVVLYQRRIIQHEIDLKSIAEKKRLEVLQASLQAEEDERYRIAGELHDDLGATLSATRLLIHHEEQLSTNHDILQKAGSLVDESIQKIRSISHNLQPPTLEKLGLLSSITELHNNLNKSKSAEVTITTVSNIPRFDPKNELHVYRIIQELITNLLKHSKPKSIHFHLATSDTELQIAISHDGIPFNHKKYLHLLENGNGIGLKNIDNRLKFVQGNLYFNNAHQGLSSINLNVTIYSKIK